MLAARRVDRLAEVAAQIADAGGRCSTLALDVSDSASIDATAAFAALDIQVNNAGIAVEATALAQDEARWDAVVDTNLKGRFLVARATCRTMRVHGRGGSIINIASILGIRQIAGVLPYTVSKAGVIQMTKTLALEVARHDIRVNAIAPGYIGTGRNTGLWTTSSGKAMLKRIPRRRLGTPQGLSGPLLLLARDVGAMMTGSVIVVDGGHPIHSL